MDLHCLPALRCLTATLAVVALSAIHGPLGVQPAVAAEPGVVTDTTWFPPEADQVRTAAALQDSGSRWVRLGIGWHDFEPSPGVYNSWSVDAYRKELQRARAAGQRVIVVVATSPAWASGTTNVDSPPRNPADYARFIRYLAGEYGEYVDAWEIWNEQNISRFWPSGPDPTAYANLLKAAYPAVKAGDPTSKVLFGGLSQNDYAFVEAAYAAGAKGSFDVMATHPYACRPPEQIAREANGRMTANSFPAYREVRASMLAQGDDKPIWFTEFGWSTTSKACGVSEATQADYLRRSFEYMEQDPYVEVATWYNFRNNFFDNDADETEARYGLLRTDFSEKPAYGAFKAYANGTVAPPAPAPAPAPVPNAAPTVRLTAPAEGSTFSTTLDMTAIADDDKGVTRVEFVVDGKVVATDTTGPYGYSWRVPRKLSYSSHTVVARAYDAEGLSASHSVTVRRERASVTLSVAQTSVAATSASSVRPASRVRRSIRAWGSVRQHGVRSLRLRLVRLVDGTWRSGPVRRAKVRGGRFYVRFSGLTVGQLRVEAVLPHGATATREIRLH